MHRFCIAVFLTEVIDSLERGFKEKTEPDYLILEINSSRYAYNMSLSEVNFYVVKAVLNLYPIKESSGNVLTAFNQIFAQLHGVVKNYIRGPQAMSDCLKAIEVCICILFSIPMDFVFTFFCSIWKFTGKLSSERDVEVENRSNHSLPVR